MKFPKKLILIGIDGATHTFVERLVEEEKLPNISKLVDRGVFGSVLAPYPTITPNNWASLATGALYDLEIRRILETKEKPSSIVRSINATLNNKISALGFSGIPNNTVFIYFNHEHKHYDLTIPIKDEHLKSL